MMRTASLCDAAAAPRVSRVAPSSAARGARVVAKATTTAGKTFASLADAVNAGVVRGVGPFPDGVDAFGFFNDIKETEAQRYADVEITHGRVAMLAALGFLVGEYVEGSSFLFDAQVTGPAINHFQQVPPLFWGLIGAIIFVSESSRVQKAWQSPFDAAELFLMNPDHVPGDYGFDPLGLSAGKDDAWLADMKLKELNNGRLAMVSILAMVIQELRTGINILPADYAEFFGGTGALQTLEEKCAGAPDEAACAKAFEAAERAAVFGGEQVVGFLNAVDLGVTM